MPVIEIKNDLPGIAGLLTQYPVQGAALSQLAQTLLRGPSSLTEEEREMIAAVVSYENETMFCFESHKAASIALHKLSHNDDSKPLIETVIEWWNSGRTGATSNRVDSLLAVAIYVANNVPVDYDLDLCDDLKEALTDEEIHDTVLVAASFCMFNRYVKCLGTKEATPEEYEQMGEKLATQGYL